MRGERGTGSGDGDPCGYRKSGDRGDCYRIAVTNNAGGVTIKEGGITSGWVALDDSTTAVALSTDKILDRHSNGDAVTKKGTLGETWLLIAQSIQKVAVDN